MSKAFIFASVLEHSTALDTYLLYEFAEVGVMDMVRVKVVSNLSGMKGHQDVV